MEKKRCDSKSCRVFQASSLICTFFPVDELNEIIVELISILFEIRLVITLFRNAVRLCETELEQGKKIAQIRLNHARIVLLITKSET